MFSTKTKQLTPQEIVDEIHDKLDNAHVELFGELSNPQTIKNFKSKQIASKWGFKRSVNVRKLTEMSVEEATNMTNIQTNHNNCKFIRESTLMDVCDTYGLMNAPVEFFTGFIPDENLKELDSIKDLEKREKPKKGVEVNIHPQSHHSKEIKDFFKENTWLPVIANEFYEVTSKDSELDFLSYKGKTLREHGVRYEDILDYKRIPRETLFICAPPSDFDLKEFEKYKDSIESQAEKEHRQWMKEQERIAQKRREMETLDPIIYRYVKGGVQIITKWGLEGYDERLG